MAPQLPHHWVKEILLRERRSYLLQLLQYSSSIYFVY